MKLKSLRMKDFGCFTDAAIEFDRINIIVGPNGTGKSTIRRALDYALTGRCEYTDARGAGAEFLIREGAKKASIELQAEIGDRLLALVRNVPNSLQVAGMSGNTTAQQAALYEALGVQGDVVSAAINTANFISASPDEQKNILFRLAGMQFDQARLLELLQAWQKANNVAGDLGSLFDDVCPRGLAGGPEVFAVLEAQAREGRRIANKEVKSLEQALAAAKARTPVDLPPGITPEKLNEATLLLADLRRQRDQLVGEMGRVEAQATERFSAEEQVKRVESQIAALKAEAAAPVEAVDVAKLTEQIAAAEAEVARLRTESSRQASEIGKGEGAIAELRGAIQRLATTSWSHKCPLAEDLVTCPLGEDDIQKVRDDMEQRLVTATKALEAMKSVAATTRDMLSQKEKSLATLRAQLEGAQRAEAAIQARAARLETLESGLRAARERLERLPAPSNVDGLRAEKEALEGRIAKGEGLIAAIREESARLAEIAKLEKALADATARAAGLDALVQAFGASGIRATLLKEVIEPLQALASERLQALTDGQMDVTFDLGEQFQVLVTDRRGRRPLRCLSKSERLRVGVLLQDVLNGLTGLRVLVVDEADMLDPVNRSLLVNWLLAIVQDYDTILVLATMGETAPTDPGIEGLSMFVIGDDGQIVRVKE